ncbi:MAG TPA: substrate-binding domain-containing protein, partial [Chthonomonadales bacterium]|nr:substrate-binding domain-containing protein [Chthonomonadales bacterium]
HFAERGHRRIAYVGPAHNSNFLDRLEGYKAGIAEAGLPLEKDLIHAFPDWREPELLRYALESLIALKDRPTAIIAPDDGHAGWLVDAIRGAGLRVPEDVAVAGFNDIPEAQRMGGGLTTVRQPFREIGRVSVAMLLEIIAGKPARSCRVTLPTELVVRSSSEYLRER